MECTLEFLSAIAGYPVVTTRVMVIPLAIYLQAAPEHREWAIECAASLGIQWVTNPPLPAQRAKGVTRPRVKQ